MEPARVIDFGGFYLLSHFPKTFCNRGINTNTIKGTTTMVKTSVLNGKGLILINSLPKRKNKVVMVG